MEFARGSYPEVIHNDWEPNIYKEKGAKKLFSFLKKLKKILQNFFKKRWKP